MRRLILVTVLLALAGCASGKPPEDAGKPAPDAKAAASPPASPSPSSPSPSSVLAASPSPASPVPASPAAAPPGRPAAPSPVLPLNAAPQLAERLQRLDTVTCADLFVLNSDPRTGQPQLVALSLVLLGYLSARTNDYRLGDDRVGYLARLLRDRCVEAPERTVLSIVSGV